MPRLSVDIDLTYLPVQGRPESLAAIDAALTRITERITSTIQGARVTASRHEGAIIKIVIDVKKVRTLVEVTPVLRGSVYAPEVRSVAKKVEDEFGFAEMQIVSLGDLYAGKIVAALDRQHPRDLFDVREFLANEGINDALRRAFLVYMLSHHRPMAEVLAVPRKNITNEYVNGFVGMTREPVAQAELEAAREALVADIVGKMPTDHRRFLISFEEGKPDWKLLNIHGAEKLPAILWRQQNLDKLPAEKRQELVTSLAKVLKV
jgi:hypothetical protein